MKQIDLIWLLWPCHIQAAAYGLPVVATQNGGPVDILKALHNGLLVDPHDAAAITDALLSLLADKARWLECRRDGLRNIHRFSWPHHCRLYLSHVAANCDHPAPHQLLRVPASPRAASADGSLSDSLRGLSISIDASHDLKTGAGESAAAIMDALRRRHAAADRPASAAARAAGFAPGLRQSLIILAVDCYGGDGKLDAERLKKAVDMALAAGAAAGGRLGCVLSTGMTIAEAADALGACGADPAAFDALICSSGAELCYPWKELAADEEYAGHVSFRWPGAHVRSAVPRLGKADGAQEADLAADDTACSAHCHAYAAAGASKVRRPAVPCRTSRFVSSSIHGDIQLTIERVPAWISAGEEGRFDPAIATDARVPLQPRVHARVHATQRHPALGVAAASAQVSSPSLSRRGRWP
jgi:sucrose-phosphate synthase